MADTGWIYAANGRTIAGIGQSWTNPSEVTGASDDSNAFCDIVLDAKTEYLNAYTFNASVPAGATIDGIRVGVRRHASITFKLKDKALYLMEGTSTKGSNKAQNDWYPGAAAWIYYGGPAILWEAAWTATQINAGTFGVGLRTEDTTQAARVYCDSITVKIFYTEVSGADHLMMMGM